MPWRLPDPAALPACRLLALGIALVVALAPTLRFAVEPNDFAVMAALLGGAVVAAAWLRRSGRTRPAEVLQGWVVLVASAIATGCLSVLLATWAPPLRDAQLADADRLLFPLLSWPAMARGLAHRPGVVGAMQAIYSTLLWQPFVLVALLAATNRRRAMWRFLHAWLLALAACLAVFALVPAVSAQVHYGFPRGSLAGLSVDAGWGPTAILLRVRSGALHVLAGGSMAGMIDFPSFHAAGATLLGWGFARAGAVGRPFVALNLLMIPTVPLVGSHYFVDVLAGVLLAALVIRATRPPLTRR